MASSDVDERLAKRSPRPTLAVRCRPTRSIPARPDRRRPAVSARTEGSNPTPGLPCDAPSDHQRRTRIDISDTAAIDPCVSVILPCYNAVDVVERVVSRALSSPFTAEVIVVDGGSSDGSLLALQRITDPRLSVIDQGQNLGRGAGLRRGFVEATQPFVIVQDVDDEYDSDDFSLLLEPLLSGKADAVFGSRFISRPHRVLTWTHTLANKILTLLSDAVTNLNLTDVATGCKAFRREALLELDLEQDRFGFEFEVTAKAAAAGWRIHEVGISFDGRGHRPARAFCWREGVRALYCISRYSSIGSRMAAPRTDATGMARRVVTFDEADESLAATLDNLDDAGNYAGWIIDMIAPYVGGDIVELGAGHGTMSERLRRFGRVTACEPSSRAAARLEERFADASDVRVVGKDIAGTMAGAAFDSAVMINVLEHIADDLGALTDVYDGLRPGGVLAVFVPAHEALYSNFDRLIGHQRRYRRSTLTQVLSRAGFEIVELHYVNLPGMVAWLVIARTLGRTPSSSELLRLFDKVVVPIVRRVEDRWRVPSGNSLLAIARKPAAPTSER